MPANTHKHTGQSHWTHTATEHSRQPDTPSSMNKRLMLSLWYLPLRHCHFISQAPCFECASIVILAVCWKYSSHNVTFMVCSSTAPVRLMSQEEKKSAHDLLEHTQLLMFKREDAAFCLFSGVSTRAQVRTPACVYTAAVQNAFLKPFQHQPTFFSPFLVLKRAQLNSHLSLKVRWLLLLVVGAVLVRDKITYRHFCVYWANSISWGSKQGRPCSGGSRHQ